jgi:hypothetical protein
VFLSEQLVFIIESPQWCPNLIKMDSEAAALIKNGISRATISGCNLHFNPCLWSEIQAIGLSLQYK